MKKNSIISIISFAAGFAGCYALFSSGLVSTTQNEDKGAPHSLHSFHQTESSSSQNAHTNRTLNPTGKAQRLEHLLELSVPEALHSWQILNEAEAEALRIPLFQSWAQKDPQATAHYIKNNLEGSQQQLALEALIEGWSHHSPHAALSWLSSNQYTDENSLYLYEKALAPLLQNAPQTVAQALNDLPNTLNKDYLYQTVAQAWSQKNIYQAFEWVETIENPTLLKTTYYTILNQYSQEQPLEAIQLIQELPNGSPKQELIHQAAYALSATDSQAALDWITTFENSDNAITATRGVLEAIAEKNPLQAWEMGLEMKQQKHNPSTLQTIAQQIAQTDPVKFSQEVAQLPESQFKQETAEQLALVWTQQSPEAAQSWILQLPISETRDAALFGYLGTYQNAHPKEALRLAAQLQDPDRRNYMLNQITENQIRNGQLLSEQDIAALALADSEKEQLYHLLKGAENVINEIVLPTY